MYLILALVKSTHNTCFYGEVRELYLELIHVGLDKGGYLVNIFLISPQKHMLWVLIRSASVRHF